MTATAGIDVPQRRLQPADAPTAARPDVVVRLHRDALPVQAVKPDLEQLTRALHAVVEALAPGLHAEISLADADIARPLPASGPSGVSGEVPAADIVGDDHIRLDRRSRTLTVDGEPVALTKREFELLAHLAQHEGLALSRRELMNAVWHERYLPGDRTVDVHVRRVRVKLGDHADRVTTLRGFGYRFG